MHDWKKVFEKYLCRYCGQISSDPAWHDENTVCPGLTRFDGCESCADLNHLVNVGTQWILHIGSKITALKIANEELCRKLSDYAMEHDKARENE